MKPPDVQAAGAVVLRRSATGPPQVLLVHRPRYDDWSLPKGKANRSEPLPVCAVREVAEETGATVRLTVPLGVHAYPVDDVVKQVHWWVAEVVAEGQPTASAAEVDAVRWLPVEEALEQLSYLDERQRLAAAAEQPAATPLLILRHAKALPRKDWDGSDVRRPLTTWGRRQSRALIPLLEAFGVRRVVSSAAVRCLQTVTPFQRAAGLGLEGWNALTEDAGEADPDGVTAAMERLRREVVTTCTPTVVCGHRPLLPTMLAPLNVPNQAFGTAEISAVTLGSDGTVLSSERLRV